MIYAQINDGVIINTIQIDNISLLPLFFVDQNGNPYDLIKKIDDIVPQPGIGWLYSLTTYSYYPPLTIAQTIIVNSVDLGNQIRLQWDAMNLQQNIYGAGQTIAFLNYVGSLYQLLSLGYLNDAYDAITSMINDTSPTKTDLDPFLTNDILYIFQSEIQDFLITLPNLG